MPPEELLDTHPRTNDNDNNNKNKNNNKDKHKNTDNNIIMMQIQTCDNKNDI